MSSLDMIFSLETRAFFNSRNWEEKLYNLQNTIEEAALLLYNQNPKLANEFLTSYSNSKAIEALEMTKNMIKRLHTLIAHYNGPL